jgi:hypothetical protein
LVQFDPVDSLLECLVGVDPRPEGGRVSLSLSTEPKSGTLNADEHAHLESILNDLETIEFFQTSLLISPNDATLKKTLPEQLAKIDAYRRKVSTPEVRPVIDMTLALADVVTAITETQSNNNDRAEQDMRSAQSLYRSLGWQDYSEDTLKALAQRQLDKWKLDPQRKVYGK